MALTTVPTLSAQPKPPTPVEVEFSLEEARPNPFRFSTRIPFVLGDSVASDSVSAVVSIRIFNLLHQVVAIPVVVDHPKAAGLRLDHVRYLSAGRHEAFWDGTDERGRRVASGPYFVQLIVEGRSAVKKLIVSR